MIIIWSEQFGSLIVILLVSHTTGWIPTNGPHRSLSLRFQPVHHARLHGAHIDSRTPIRSAEAAKAPNGFPPPAGCRFSGGILVDSAWEDASDDTSMDVTLEVLPVLALIAACTTPLTSLGPISIC